MSEQVKVNFTGVFSCSEKLGSLMDQLENELTNYEASLNQLNASIHDEGYQQYANMVSTIIKALRANKESGIVLRKKMLAYAKELVLAQKLNS